MTRELILHKVAQGDPAAVRELLDRYGGLVYSLARRFILDPSEIEDAVQEVFSQLWQNAGRFDPRLGAEETFVSTITRRRLIDRRRRIRRRTRDQVDADVGLQPAPDMEAASDLRDEAARAAELLATLRPEQQTCLRLSIYRGLSHEEIARITGLPLGTVKTHVRRGLISLRDLMIQGPGQADGESPEPQTRRRTRGTSETKA
ncbi:MAG: sigma-70 family RNA polymerase sigma factor [Phycisphaerales bacterium]